MIKTLSHILLAGMVSLAPPGASMIAYSCDVTGATTQVVSTLGAGSHVDECCDEEDACAQAMTSNDCCRATVFSLPPTSPAPAPVATDATVALVPFDILAPQVTARLSGMRGSRPVCRPLSRNLPLLI